MWRRLSSKARAKSCTSLLHFQYFQCCLQCPQYISKLLCKSVSSQLRSMISILFLSSSNLFAANLLWSKWRPFLASRFCLRLAQLSCTSASIRSALTMVRSLGNTLWFLTRQTSLISSRRKPKEAEAFMTSRMLQIHGHSLTFLNQLRLVLKMVLLARRPPPPSSIPSSPSPSDPGSSDKALSWRVGVGGGQSFWSGIEMLSELFQGKNRKELFSSRRIPEERGSSEQPQNKESMSYIKLMVFKQLDS